MPAREDYTIPRRLQTTTGDKRRVGLELEFAGLEFRESIGVVEQVFGRPAQTTSQAEGTVKHERWGTFKVEVDHELIKSLAQRRARWRQDAHNRGELRGSPEHDPVVTWLVNLSTELVPVEVVCPPIDIDSLADLDPLVDGLRAAGALGTSESLLYAFGVHINVELPSLEPAVIGRYLRAYAIAQDWLLETHDVDLSRRVTPFIDLYGARYRRRVAAYDDDVSLTTLLDDYLRFNPTRNRALDMLPLFRYLDEERIAGEISDPRVHARPTFHYRMPNCRINEPDWRLADDWNTWCVLEAIADDGDLLRELCAEYRAYEANLINLGPPPWHRTLTRLRADLVSA